MPAATEAGQQRLGQVLGLAAGYLDDRGADTARLDAEVLLADLLDCDRLRLYLDHDKPLSEQELAGYRTRIARRAGGEPVARILGRREFWSMELSLSPAVLVPRPETELLVELGLARLSGALPAGPTALELGTGAGGVALALARELPEARITGTDISAEALHTAQDNARRLDLDGRVEWLLGDLFAPVSGRRFDLVLMNPPYLTTAELRAAPAEVREHDPQQALDGGADGLDVVRRLLREGSGHLGPGAALLVEIGTGQASATLELAHDCGLNPAGIHKDLSGIPRVLELEVGRGT